jgi:hypothetical protein
VSGIQHPEPSIQPSEVQALEPALQVPASSIRPAKIRGLVKRTSGAELVRLTVYVTPETAVKLRRHCFENDRELSEIAGPAIEKAVAKL